MFGKSPFIFDDSFLSVYHSADVAVFSRLLAYKRDKYKPYELGSLRRFFSAGGAGKPAYGPPPAGMAAPPGGTVPPGTANTEYQHITFK